MRFTSFAAEQEHLAHQPDLDSCPECGSPLVEKSGEKVCHTCGTKQPIINTSLGAQTKKAFLPLLLEGLGAAEGGGALAGGMGAAEGAGGAGLGVNQMGMLMGQAMQGQGQEQEPAVEPGAPGAFGNPGQSMSIAPPGVVGAVTAGTFGEDEIGSANKNRGDNSQPDRASETGIEGSEEIGDSPEQNKGVGADAASTGANSGEQTDLQDGSLPDVASKAFHQNLPLVVQFAFSDQSGSSHPILKALDEMLEQAYPGYKDGETFNESETGESPTEKMEETIGQDLDDDEEQNEPEEHAGAPAEVKPKMTPISKKASDFPHPYAKCKRTGLTFDPREDHCPHCLNANLPDCTKEDSPENKQASIDEHAPWNMGKTAIPASSVGFGYQVPGAGQVAPDQATMGPTTPGQNPQCTVCGQSHVPGMCPMAEGLQNGAGATSGTATAPVTPPPPMTVITALDDDLESYSRQDEQEQHHDNRYEDGPTETGWYEDWKGPGEKDEDNPWVDEAGESLQPGHDYEMHSSQYAIPDKITVEHVGPDKITFLIHSGDVDYRDEIDKEDVANYGYTFRAPKDAELDSESGFDAADAALPQGPPPTKTQPRKQLNLTDRRPHAGGYLDNESETQAGPFGGTLRPGACDFCGDDSQGVYKIVAGSICPGCSHPDTPVGAEKPGGGAAVPSSSIDPGPQQDDLSAPPTKQGALFSNSYVDPLGNEMEYVGSFRGDDTDSRSWLMSSSSSAIDVDPGIMARLAGKDFSPSEQRAFIDEQGVGGPARNLHKLDLSETHYELDGEYGDSLW